MHVCLWIKLKWLFWKPKNYSLCHGLDILTIFFLSTHGEQELQTFCIVLMSSILISNLHMRQAKKSITFLDLKNGQIITDLYVKSTDPH